jgi:hypothetical protein
MNLSDIKSGTQMRPPRIILCGTEKIGKSTFAAGAPNPVFLPIKGEEGIDALDVARVPVVETYDALMDVFKMLYEQKHDYQSVVIDSISTLEPIVWDAVCNQGNVDSIEQYAGGFGKGYVEAVSKWRNICAALDSLREKGMSSILIGHVAVRLFSDPVSESYDCYELDINKKAASALMRWSDCILFANCKVAVKEGQKNSRGVLRDDRVLHTQKRPAHPGGGRGVYGQLPYELELDFGTFAEAVKTKMKGK